MKNGRIAASLQTIESKDVSLGELSGQFFVVPNFQCEYVWGTEEVRRLLEDINSEFSASDRANASRWGPFFNRLTHFPRCESGLGLVALDSRSARLGRNRHNVHPRRWAPPASSQVQGEMGHD